MRTITLKRTEMEGLTRREFLKRLRAEYPELKLTNVAYNPSWPVTEPCWAYGSGGDIRIVWEEHLQFENAKEEEVGDDLS